MRDDPASLFPCPPPAPPSASALSHLVPFLARRPRSSRGPRKPQGPGDPIFTSGTRGATFTLLGEVERVRAEMQSWYVEGWFLGMNGGGRNLPGNPSRLWGPRGLGLRFDQEAQCSLLGLQDHAPQGIPENRGGGSGMIAITVDLIYWRVCKQPELGGYHQSRPFPTQQPEGAINIQVRARDSSPRSPPRLPPHLEEKSSPGISGGPTRPAPISSVPSPPPTHFPPATRPPHCFLQPQDFAHALPPFS